MAKYRMDIFKPGRKPGHPAPSLWRRRDIYSDASQRTLTNFYLRDSAGRSIYQSVGKGPC